MELTKVFFKFAIAIVFALTTAGLIHVTWITMKAAANSTQVGLLQLGKWNRALHDGRTINRKAETKKKEK